jgi:iron complex transport system substrate-binding protein
LLAYLTKFIWPIEEESRMKKQLLLLMRSCQKVLTISCAAVSATFVVVILSSHSVFAQPINFNTGEFRIVSAGGSITEILFALDLNEQIVAVDTSSSFPQAAQGLPKIGYYRQLGTEGVLSLQPSHLFASAGVGPQKVIQQLETVGVEIKIFEHQRTVDGLLGLITEIGEQTNRADSAEKLVAQINQDILNLPNLAKQKHVTFLMSVNERGLMAAGNNTVPNLLMDLLGLKNPFSNIEGFKPISSEALIASNTQVIFMPVHQTRGLDANAICKLPALSQWARIYGCNIEIVDSLLFLGLTPRLAQAAEMMALRLQNIELTQQASL